MTKVRTVLKENTSILPVKNPQLSLKFKRVSRPKQSISSQVLR
jgi:hypothetical protein